MRIRSLESRKQSFEILQFSGGCYYVLHPANETHAKHLHLFYFALSGEISLIQTDHVSTEKPAYSTHASSATPTSPLTKFMSLMR
jgi:hypothetical protein